MNRLRTRLTHLETRLLMTHGEAEKLVESLLSASQTHAPGSVDALAREFAGSLVTAFRGRAVLNQEGMEQLCDLFIASIRQAVTPEQSRAIACALRPQSREAVPCGH